MTTLVPSCPSGNVNLDCIDFDDLRAYSKDSRNHRLLRAYATYKSLAVALRLSGSIHSAIRYENDCDHIYDMLPEDLRW